jgi:hypothetical protein
VAAALLLLECDCIRSGLNRCASQAPVNWAWAGPLGLGFGESLIPIQRCRRIFAGQRYGSAPLVRRLGTDP